MKVVNYHHYKDNPIRLHEEFGDNWMYVGRPNKTHNLAASPLANPFVDNPKKVGQVVDDPVAAYRSWLWKKILVKDTAVMGALARMNHETGLVCWCAPDDCHADVIVKAWHYLTYGQFDVIPSQFPTKALSIKQPWAWLIIRPDAIDPVHRGALYLSGEMKDVENRSWDTSVRGHFLIHAGKTVDKLGYDYVRGSWPYIPMPPLGELETGGIVGAAKLLDVVEHSGSQLMWLSANLAEVVPNMESSSIRTNLAHVCECLR